MSAEFADRPEVTVSTMVRDGVPVIVFLLFYACYDGENFAEFTTSLHSIYFCLNV